MTHKTPNCTTSDTDIVHGAAPTFLSTITAHADYINTTTQSQFAFDLARMVAPHLDFATVARQNCKPRLYCNFASHRAAYKSSICPGRYSRNGSHLSSLCHLHSCRLKLPPYYFRIKHWTPTRSEQLQMDIVTHGSSTRNTTGQLGRALGKWQDAETSLSASSLRTPAQR